jgi:fluoride exporter
MDQDPQDEHLRHTHEPGVRGGDPLDESVLPRLGLSTTALLAIFVGGAIGTIARYLLDAYHPLASGGFPWPTLVINLSGSLAIGLLVPISEHVAHRAPLVRPLLIVGFLGGWTTYSTLAVESALLAKDGDMATCLAYLAATVFGGLSLVVVGNVLGRRVVQA